MQSLQHTSPVSFIPSQAQKEQASAWFDSLQKIITQSLEKLEEELASMDGVRPNLPDPGLPAQTFAFTPWKRQEDGQEGDFGGGTMGVLRGGRVFEKAGVNVSTVHGMFSEKFAKEIPGCEGSSDEARRFWASGLSLVIHPRNPFVPTVHMNTRMIVTQKGWFGGGADLTPCIPFEEDTRDFHAAFQKACDEHHPTYYPRFKKWCDEYFYLPHRQEPRGIGGIFYDYLEDDSFENLFSFTKAVGLAFNAIYPEIVRRHYMKPYGDKEKRAQLKKRSRYVEFNLIYDRGTHFGLKTGGNTDAILMSMPPMAMWE